MIATPPSVLELPRIDFTAQVVIAAPVDIAFEALLDELGPEGELPGPTPFPMKIETWPGGRWFRDLGNHAGHLWGHVQVIKPPGLLEICGPLFMSFPAMNHLQWRLTAEGSATRLQFTHRGTGMIPSEMPTQVGTGWKHWLDRLDGLAQRRLAKNSK